MTEHQEEYIFDEPECCGMFETRSGARQSRRASSLQIEHDHSTSQTSVSMRTCCRISGTATIVSTPALERSRTCEVRDELELPQWWPSRRRKNGQMHSLRVLFLQRAFNAKCNQCLASQKAKVNVGGTRLFNTLTLSVYASPCASGTVR